MKAFNKKWGLLLIIATAGFLFFLQCKKSPTEPKPDEENCDYEPGNRSFTWRMDTVAWWPSEVGGVWAFSDNDAYVMGKILQRKNGNTEHYAGLHWNGTEWDTEIKDLKGISENVSEFTDVTGDDHFLAATGIWGIDNFIYPGIAEFNNSTKNWKSYQFQTEGTLYSVWTDKKGYFIAGGTNGMIYQKDGYDAEWVYSKAPTDFIIAKISGVSKEEIYILAGINLVTGYSYQQLWKFDGNNWDKLIDNQDTSNTIIKLPPTIGYLKGMAAFKCPSSDSLQIYIAGNESFIINQNSKTSKYLVENLIYRGLPLSAQNYGAGRVFLFSPKDCWITGLQYEIYHWNGDDFQKIEPIPTLPYGDFTGLAQRMQKTSSGKVWILLENQSQVYTVLQGAP